MPTMRANPPGNRERGKSIDRPRRFTFIFFRRPPLSVSIPAPRHPALHDLLFFRLMDDANNFCRRM